MIKRLVALALAVICLTAIMASGFPEPQPVASPYRRPWWGGGHGGWGGGWGGGLWGGGWGHGGWGHRPYPPIWFRG